MSLNVNRPLGPAGTGCLFNSSEPGLRHLIVSTVIGMKTIIQVISSEFVLHIDRRDPLARIVTFGDDAGDSGIELINSVLSGLSDMVVKN